MSTSKRKKRNKARKGENQANAQKKNKGGGIPPPIEAGLRETNPSSRRESTRTASGEQSKGLADDRKTNVEAEKDALTITDQSQTQEEKWKGRNSSQPGTPILVVDRPNKNRQTYRGEVRIIFTRIINWNPDSMPDDGQTPSTLSGIRLKTWLWLIVIGITLVMGFVSEDARVALMNLMNAVAELVDAMNRPRP